MQPTSEFRSSPRQLDRVEYTFELLADGRLELTVIGKCSSRRKALWTYSEAFGLTPADLSASDAIAHVTLVCLQERPTTLQSLENALRGVGWEEVPLPWG